MAQFGRNNFYADEEEGEEEYHDGRGGGGGGGSSKKNAFDDDAPDELLRMRAQRTKHEDGCLQSTQRALASIADSEKTGILTAEELMSQREQLERVDQRLDETQTTLKSSQRSLNGIKSVFGGFANMFKRKDAALPPSPVRSQAVPSTRLKGVVENLDDDDEASTSGRPRVLTKRGTDVGGFYANDDDDDDNDVKTVSRSSTTSSGFSQQNRLEESRKVHSARMQEVDDNLDLMSGGLGRLKNLAVGLNDEIEAQNDLLDRINDKVMDTDDTLWHQQKQIKRILK